MQYRITLTLKKLPDAQILLMNVGSHEIYH